MEHFREFNPSHAYVIRSKVAKKPSSTGVVVLPSLSIAEEAIRKMKDSTILGEYFINLKLEDSHRACDDRKLVKHVTPTSKDSKGASRAALEVKVSHLARETTIKDLKQFFKKFGPLDGLPILRTRGYRPYAIVKFQSAESANRAASIENPILKGCNITTKIKESESGKSMPLTKHKIKESLAETETKTGETSKSNIKNITKTLMLETTEWNMLMTKWPKLTTMSSFSTLLEIIKSSYSDNDLTYEASVEKSYLEIKGKRNIVQQFCEDIKAVSASGELRVDV